MEGRAGRAWRHEQHILEAPENPFVFGSMSQESTLSHFVENQVTLAEPGLNRPL